MKIKRIALIGLGAMGVFFAPRLYEAFGDDFILLQVVNVKNDWKVKELRSMALTTDFRS